MEKVIERLTVKTPETQSKSIDALDELKKKQNKKKKITIKDIFIKK